MNSLAMVHDQQPQVISTMAHIPTLDTPAPQAAEREAKVIEQVVQGRRGLVGNGQSPTMLNGKCAQRS